MVGNIIVLDVETTGLDPHHGDRIFCWGYITEKGEYGFVEKSPQAIEWIRGLFNDPNKILVFHHAKFDLQMFWFEGIDIFNAKATVDCTLILSKLYNGLMNSYELIDLASKFVGRKTGDKTDIVDWLKANKRSFVKQFGRELTFADAPKDLVKRRALWDVESTLYLWGFMKPKVMRQCPELYKTERQLMFVVIDMQLTGVQVDITRAKALRFKARQGVQKLMADLQRLVCPLTVKYLECSSCGKKVKSALLKQDKIPKCCTKCGAEGVVEVFERTLEHGEFNPNSSPIHLPAAFEAAGIELKYKTKPKKGKRGKPGSAGGGWSFDEYAMIRYVPAQLAEIIRESGEEGWPFEKFYTAIRSAMIEHLLPKSMLLPPLILKVRELGKMISTYYNHIIDHSVDKFTAPNGREYGTLHCSFNQSEAMTGRFSSSNPNLQNMPRILGPRECFVPRKSRRNWHFDYEQVEMKLFVHFAKDEKMADAFRNGEDIHLRVATEIYGLPPDQISKEKRKRAKSVNFGIIYGSGPSKQSETLTSRGLPTSVQEATTLVANYHRRFPSVHRLTNELKIELARKGYVQNPLGRLYHIEKRFGYTAINYMCQGTSADVMKRAMVAVWLYLRSIRSKSRILVTVHDELIIEIPRSEELTVVPEIKRLMEDHTNFFLPITVGVEVSPRRWSEKVDPAELA